jgi:hypothetical protein
MTEFFPFISLSLAAISYSMLDIYVVEMTPLVFSVTCILQTLRRFSLKGRCYHLLSILQTIYHIFHHYIQRAHNYKKKIGSCNQSLIQVKNTSCSKCTYRRELNENAKTEHYKSLCSYIHFNLLQLFFLMFILTSCDTCYQYSFSTIRCIKLKFRIFWFLFVINKALGSTIRLSTLGTACTQITFTLSTPISPIKKDSEKRKIIQNLGRSNTDTTLKTLQLKPNEGLQYK